MKNIAGTFLFTIAGILPLSNAKGINGLTPVDELPMQTRVQVYKKVLEISKADKSIFDNPNAVIAIDEEGNVYVIDKLKTKFNELAQPSCIND